ncbi:MAG: dihydroorotate dehydrogenase electron transfer subunit [Candidatus Margulisiibacteriota bacterium]|jgi:dihydroorotate dehydrogenase electron transfer subunit
MQRAETKVSQNHNIREGPFWYFRNAYDIYKQMKREPLYQIKENHRLQGPYFLMVLVGLPASQAGQFLNVLCQADDRFLLRRPISINRTVGHDTHLVYKVIGAGTELLSQRKPGEYLDVLGPLGRGWMIEDRSQKTGDSSQEQHILVGGGIGIAPLLGLAEVLVGQGKKVTALLGGRTKEDVICVKEFEALGGEVLISTDDGSCGEQCLVTELLAKKTPPCSHLYTCGPKPMMKAVAQMAQKHQVPCQVSLEEMMGCGLGGCVCCVCATKYGYQKICAEGPVFKAEEIIW